MRLEMVSRASNGRPITSSRSAPNISSSVALISTTAPSAANVRKPHGAQSSSASIRTLLPRQLDLLDVCRREVSLDRLDGLCRMTHMGTVAGRLQLVESAAPQLAREVVADAVG